MREKIISILIPTYNEEKDIAKCLDSLKHQTYRKIEIIIVDDGSTDNTLNEIKKFKDVKIIKGEHKGPGFSRNLGAKKAKGEILVFVDADMTFEKNYLKNLVSPILKDSKIIGTTHYYETAENFHNIWSRCWGKLRVFRKNEKYGRVFRAIRKNKFIELGGFDPKYGYADDQTFWFKYKISSVVAKNTICYHKNPETLRDVYRQSRWTGAAIENFFLKLPIINYFLLFLLALISPLIIIIFSVNKAYKNKDFKILFPWMFIFIFFRYFGTIKGIINKVHFNKNVR